MQYTGFEPPAITRTHKYILVMPDAKWSVERDWPRKCALRTNVTVQREIRNPVSLVTVYDINEDVRQHVSRTQFVRPSFE